MNPPVSSLLSKLEEFRKLDPAPEKGRLFSYLYEAGDPELKKLAAEVYRLFLDTNALDPTVFRSALLFEKEVVSFSKKLVNAGEEVVGTATYGGTESIMIALTAPGNGIGRDGLTPLK